MGRLNRPGFDVLKRIRFSPKRPAPPGRVFQSRGRDLIPLPISAYELVRHVSEEGWTEYLFYTIGMDGSEIGDAWSQNLETMLQWGEAEGIARNEWETVDGEELQVIREYQVARECRMSAGLRAVFEKDMPCRPCPSVIQIGKLKGHRFPQASYSRYLDQEGRELGSRSHATLNGAWLSASLELGIEEAELFGHAWAVKLAADREKFEIVRRIRPWPRHRAFQAEKMKSGRAPSEVPEELQIVFPRGESAPHVWLRGLDPEGNVLFNRGYGDFGLALKRAMEEFDIQVDEWHVAGPY